MPSERAPSSRNLVTTEWLAERLESPTMVIVDGSNYLATTNRSGRAEYMAKHIPGALFFDVDAIADRSTSLPHMLPTPERFSESVGTLGIGDGDTIVVYDGAGLHSAPRVWWTFQIFGAANVFILDGGLPKWLSEGRRIESGEVRREARRFNARFRSEAVATLTDMTATLLNDAVQIVDARPADRFHGVAPEPRPGMRSGHMPGAFNVPYANLIEDGRLVDVERLARAFSAAGVDISKPTITTCGSGVSAAVLWFALDALGKAPKALYDGSWAEWGALADVQVEQDQGARD